MTYQEISCTIQQVVLRKLHLSFMRFCGTINGLAGRQIRKEKTMNRKMLIAVCIGFIAAVFVLYRPQCSMAGVNVNVGINIPLPALVMPAPPEVVVIPGTYAYFAPGVDVDIFFYHNYWYRPYRGRWYRSFGYDGPWNFIPERRVPGVLLHLPPGYRHMPPGHERIPYGQLKKNWRNWEREEYWDRQQRRSTGEQRREAREHRREYRGYGDRGNHGEHEDHGRHGRHWDD
jgi:hypothetical protein